ncbi:MAG TPA: deiodinase-like protein [Thermoanaerobaculia bacterium]|nr:deiodinase-like protein [Thermoanaerobaculia bacterium]
MGTPTGRLAFAVIMAVSLLAAGCSLFPKEAGAPLAHFAEQAPAPGETAPLFELRDLNGRIVRLADLLGDRPVVLQLGSHSCPVYRYRRHWMDGLIEELQDRVHFLLVYTIEAHPVGSKSPHADGEWDPWINRLTRVRVRQPSTMEERVAQAEHSRTKLKLERAMVVDEMDNSVWGAYGAASSPAFVIDRNGVVVAGQVWIEPAQIRELLERLLAEGSP